MCTAQLVAALTFSLFPAPVTHDSVRAPIADSATTAATPSAGVSQRTGPRQFPVGISARESLGPNDAAGSDTTARRPRAIEHSDAYYSRLTVHRIASYAELPLFGAEYVLGQRLLNDERTGYPPSGLKQAHLAVALGLGALFTVNTITGVWNLWDSHSDPDNRTVHIVHSVAMLSADAGFAWAGAIGGSARNSSSGAQHHKAVSIGSMALATAGTAMMWLFNK